eukprot:CAMPEP_0185508020 /NCGR_PEP_ID=MMETSP1366-20130426/43503_1 /TAXON_ID=38817 /ORGANISM="Gephyrocapsa oceanica, Strain RCC1303" /LENGTH=50 /DNA_ID=CAMNT_0028118339 /DNA_START=142 /DNA_END=290 /DNA_ORIENTATION=+
MTICGALSPATAEHCEPDAIERAPRNAASQSLSSSGVGACSSHFRALGSP